jgi:hypothetical protein
MAQSSFLLEWLMNKRDKAALLNRRDAAGKAQSKDKLRQFQDPGGNKLKA